MCKRALVDALYVGLPLLFASRFFPLLHPASHAIAGPDPALNGWVRQSMSHALVRDPPHWHAGNTFHQWERDRVAMVTR